MLAILDRIDPDSSSISHLIELVEQLRPKRATDIERAAANVRTLTQLLRGNPEHAARLRQYLVQVLEARRHASLYTDIGILSNDGFFTELKRRISYRILPPALGDVYLSDALEQVLYRQTDHTWIRGVAPAVWFELFDAISSSEGPAGRVADVTVRGLLEAIRTLSCRVCALGLEPRLIHSFDAIEHFDSPFLMQNIEVNDYLDAYDALLAGETMEIESARHLLVMLDQCDEVVAKVRKRALVFGTSIALTYLVVALSQSIDRLRKLLYLVDTTGELPAPPGVDLEAMARDATSEPPCKRPVSLQEAGAVAMALELIEAHNHKYAVRDLFADNIDLLARNVTENASRTGEHYIAESRRDLRGMFNAGAGAGFIIGFMALFKVMLSYLRAAPLVETFLFSMNYALGFMLIHVLHFTVATKQPAMTASRIAAELHMPDGKTPDPDSMAELVNKVFRTQFFAVFGNLVTVLPTAYLIAIGYAALTGQHMVSPEKAMKMLHEIDPIGGPALWYAAVAGVCLFIAGLISGYYDNKALYTHMAHRIYQLRGLGRVIGSDRLRRFARYMEDNLGGLMGNFFFGILLGTMGLIGYLLGIPLDIRHVTFSAAYFSFSFVGLGQDISWQLAGLSIAGVLLIGTVNLLVSFFLALWVALRSRRIRFREAAPRHAVLVLRGLLRRFYTAPVQFFIGPRDTAEAAK